MLKRALVTLGLAAIVSIAARAAVLIHLNDAELVGHSAHIVEATVKDVSTAWMDPDGNGREEIWTTVRVRVDRVLKGGSSVGDVLTIRQLGGKIGDIEYHIFGMPEFAAGERDLLFLDARLDNSRYTPLVGLAQGRWKIRKTQEGAEVARRDFKDSCFMDPDRGIEEQKPSEAEEPYEDVLGRFRKEVAVEATLKSQKEAK